jgi:hypothetical protein
MGQERMIAHLQLQLDLVFPSSCWLEQWFVVLLCSTDSQKKKDMT